MSKKTLEIATAKGNDVLVQVKSNQKQLLENCQDTARLSKPQDVYQSEYSKKHGRIEQRTVSVFTDLDFIQDDEWKKYIRSIIVVDRYRESLNTESKQWVIATEKSHYIFTTILPAKQMHDIVKNHWLIENANNYVRDVSLCEDSSKIKQGAGTMARMRSFALNIFRSHNKNEIKANLYKNSICIDLLMKYKI